MQRRAERGGFSSSWQWLLALFTVAGLAEAALWGQMGAFTPLYLPRLGIPEADVPTWTGIVVAVSGVLGIPFLPLWGALADRYSRKPVIVRSYVAYVVASALAMVAGNVWVFLAGRAAMSFTLGNTGLMMATLSERVAPSRIGLAFAVMNSAPAVGSFAGPLLGGPVVDRYGFPTLLAADLAVLVVLTFAVAFGYRDAYAGTNRGSLFSMAVDSVRIVWQSRRLRTLFPALFLLFAGWMMAFTYLPLAVTAMYHGDEPGMAVGVIAGVGGLSALFLSPLFGLLADRYGHWRVLVLGGAGLALLWPLPALAPDLTAFALAWSLVSGLASGVFAISFGVLAASTSEETRGRVMAFAYLPTNLGYTVGPAIGSAAIRFGIAAVFPVAAVLTSLGVGALVLARRQRTG